MRTRALSLIIALGYWLAGAGSGVAGRWSGPGTQFDPPLSPPLTVLRPFAPPIHQWEVGNRGVDLAAFAGERVFAATPGVVVYAGMLAGRGVISIRDGSLRTTYEPVDPVVHPGDRVVAGQLIGYVSIAADACGPPGSCLHWGALQNDVYVNPMGLLRAAPVRLWPIWADDPPDLRPG